jgi:hypothetical protein
MHLVIERREGNAEVGPWQQAMIFLPDNSEIQIWAVAIQHFDHFCGYIGIDREMWNAVGRTLDDSDLEKLGVTFEGIGRDFHQIPSNMLRKFTVTQPEFWIGIDWAPHAVGNHEEAFLMLEMLAVSYQRLIDATCEVLFSA